MPSTAPATASLHQPAPHRAPHRTAPDSSSVHCNTRDQPTVPHAPRAGRQAHRPSNAPLWRALPSGQMNASCTCAARANARCGASFQVPLAEHFQLPLDTMRTHACLSPLRQWRARGIGPPGAAGGAAPPRTQTCTCAHAHLEHKQHKTPRTTKTARTPAWGGPPRRQDPGSASPCCMPCFRFLPEAQQLHVKDLRQQEAGEGGEVKP